MGIIGGHQGLTVYRENGIIRKWAYGGEKALRRCLNGIHQEARMLRELKGTGFAPELIEEGEDYIIEEDLGVSQPVESGDALRRNGVRLLWALQQHRISHGDPWLTLAPSSKKKGNIIIRDDRPMLVDFKMSRFFDEPVSDYRETSDQYHFWLNLAKAMPPGVSSSLIDRWLAVVVALGGETPGNPLEGKSLLDLGCGQGDFCAMAAAAGMTAHGVDSDEGLIAEAKTLWTDMAEKVSFSQHDPGRSCEACGNARYDVVLLNGNMIWKKEDT